MPRARFIAFVVSYGVVAGGYSALPTIITEIYGIQNYTSVNGFIYFIRAPIAGVILVATSGAWVLLGVSILGTQTRYIDVVIYYQVTFLCGVYMCALVRCEGQWVCTGVEGQSNYLDYYRRSRLRCSAHNSTTINIYHWIVHVG